MNSIQIHHKSKVITKKLLILALVFSFLGGMILFSNLRVYAAVPPDSPISFNQRCNFKDNKAACITAYTNCNSVVSCIDGVDVQVAQKPTFRGNIYLYCQIQSTPFAQNCHRAVQAKCGSLATAQQPECKRLEAIRLAGVNNLAPHPAALAAGGPAGPAGPGGATGAGDLPSLAPKFPGATSTCGRGDQVVETKFNLGCEHKADNPIIDMVYAFIKFLAFGVGLILVISIIYAGIQYSTSGGNAEETSKAKERILNAMVALLFYLLISAFVNFLVPGGLF